MAAGTVIEDVLGRWVEDQPEAVDAGCRVYPPKKAPQGAARPYATLARVAGGRVRSLLGPTTLVSHPRLQLDFWGRDYTQVRRLAQAVLGRIDGFRGVMGGVTVQDVTVHSDFDHDDTPDAAPAHGDELTEFRYTLDLTIWFEEG